MSDRREQIENEITALKMLLADTDYQVTKYAEGLTACSTQKEENAFREAFMAQYGDVIASRVQWRQRINELEEERDALPDPEPEIEETPVVEDTEEEESVFAPVTLEGVEEEDENPPEIVHDETEVEPGLDDGEPEIVHDEEEPEAESESETEPETESETEPETDPAPAE